MPAAEAEHSPTRLARDDERDETAPGGRAYTRAVFGLVVLSVVALAAYLAVAVALRLAPAGGAARDLRRGAWLVASTLLLVLVVLAAREMGLFTVPIVAGAFLCAALAAPWLIGAARRQSARTPVSAMPQRERALGQHQLVVMTLLVLAVAVTAVVVAMVVAPR